MTIPFKMAVLVPFSVLMHEVPFHESSQQQGKIAKIHAQIVDVCTLYTIGETLPLVYKCTQFGNPPPPD